MLDKSAVIENILDSVTNELIVASCGLVGRQVYALRDREKNFYNQAAMGSTLPIAIGLALNVNCMVIAILGDGEALMSLNSLVLCNKLKLPNLRLIIIDNGVYESTGKQETCSDAVDFSKLCQCEVYHVKLLDVLPSRIPFSPKEIKERFMNAIGNLQ